MIEHPETEQARSLPRNASHDHPRLVENPIGDITGVSSMCYACTAEATTREHVPPRGLFPKAKDLSPGLDFRRELMTVPSCRQHNTEKSGDDDFLLHVLSGSLSSNDVALTLGMGKLVRAAGRKPGLVLRLLSGATDVIHHARTGRAIDAVQLELDLARLDRSLTLVALGLHRFHFGRNWTGPLRIVPEFVVFLDDPAGDSAVIEVTAIAALMLAGAEPHGFNPSVFTYQVVSPGDGTNVMRMNFYGGTKALALFGFAEQRTASRE